MPGYRLRFGGNARMRDVEVGYYIAQLKAGDAEDALCRLREIGEVALPYLYREFVGETDSAVRALLVESAWQTRSKLALPLLSEALLDPEPCVWKEAINGLVTLALPAAIAVMKSALRRDDIEATRRDWISEAIEQAESA